MTRTRSASHESTIRARVSQCVAATALIAGLAIGTAATATAEWDIGKYDSCLARWSKQDPDDWYHNQTYCCAISGGEWSQTQGCVAPALEAQNVPQLPAPTEPPPVLQNPPTQPSNPLILTPRGPNSGTLG
jgi:hypothetical protein